MDNGEFQSYKPLVTHYQPDYNIIRSLDKLRVPILNVRAIHNLTITPIQLFAFAFSLFLFAAPMMEWCDYKSPTIATLECYGGFILYIIGFYDWYLGKTDLSLFDFIYSLTFYSWYHSECFISRYNILNDYLNFSRAVFLGLLAVVIIFITISIMRRGWIYLISLILLLIGIIFHFVWILKDKDWIKKTCGYFYFFSALFVWFTGIREGYNDIFLYGLLPPAGPIIRSKGTNWAYMPSGKIKKEEYFCKTKILCTLGPACDNEETLSRMLEEGLDGARFNFSHGSHPEHLERLKRFRKVAKSYNLYLPCVLDTKGPEIRLGKFSQPVTLSEGQHYTLTTREVIGDQQMATVDYKGITEDLKVGDTILIDDGLVGLRVDNLTQTDISCTVLNQGQINSNKGVNLPGVKTRLPSLTEKDKEDLEFGVDNDFDYVAASFIRTKQDCLNIKSILKSLGGEHIGLIAKIENQEGLDNFDEILQVADGIMVARGDLGVEVPFETLPGLQKEMIMRCRRAGKLVITATQMLDSMIKNPRPTRAEVTDVTNAIIDGTSTIMLSGETASGKHPVEAVRAMNKIALETERNLPLDELAIPMEYIVENLNLSDQYQYRLAYNYSVACSANVMKANAIICITSDGLDARILSQYRPKSPIYAITDNERTARMLSLEWSIQPVLVEEKQNFESIVQQGIQIFKAMNFLKPGDIVYVSAGESMFEDRGSDNQMFGGLMTVH